jgi:hypothetical protein
VECRSDRNLSSKSEKETTGLAVAMCAQKLKTSALLRVVEGRSVSRVLENISEGDREN